MKNFKHTEKLIIHIPTTYIQLLLICSFFFPKPFENNLETYCSKIYRLNQYIYIYVYIDSSDFKRVLPTSLC
jgi:hypothetical protein